MREIYIKNKFIKVIALLLVSSCTVFTGCEKSSDERVDLYEYIGFMNYRDESSQGERPAKDQAAVIVEGEVSEYRAIIKDGKPYVDMEAVQEYIDDRFYWDKNEGYVMYTNASSIYSSYVGESECYLDGTAEKLEYVISYTQDDVCYLSMEFVDKFADVEYNFYEEDGEVPARVCLLYGAGEYTVSTAKKNNKMRTDTDLMSSIVTDITKDDEVTVIEEGEEWYKAQTRDGFIGFVQAKYFKDSLTKKTVERENDYDTYTHNTMDEKVKLVWHQITNYTANGTFEALTEGMAGANVISPTWFTMKDKKGNIEDLSSSDYVEAAHEKGLEVWVLVDDFSSNSKGERFVDTVLAKTSSREKLEDNLIHSVIRCGADGINIDFEYISLANGDNYLQFLREMSIKCKKNGIKLSVDNYVPSEWSRYYDMEQQARVADYVIVMSYDEHTAGSEQAGPVASLSFVQKAVEDAVSLVGDSSRVIMGIPFYTRVWQETPEEYAQEDAKIIQDSVNGNYALSSEAVSMNKARELYELAGAEPAWNEETGTNYVYFEDDNSRYQIWLEDEKSIQAKLNVAVQNEIGGCACWKLGLEDKNIWNLIKDYK